MYKAVIVDDESTIVEGLSHMLPWARYGCEVVGTASDGHEALVRIREVRPDVLFTDIQMPTMDGLTLIAALRSEFPQMQVTILSGYPDFEYAQRAIRMGVSNYVLKPSKMAELEEALKTMTDNLARQAQLVPGPDAGEENSPEDSQSAGNFIIKNAEKFIEQRYAEKLTLTDVADHVYVSQWHLSKLIARHTGKNFSDLLNGVRIRKAKELLADSSLRIWEISEMTGFSDVTHFSRIFKKMENCNANEYRNRLPG